MALESTTRLLNESSLYMLHRGRLPEAADAALRALAIDEKVYGPDNPFTKTVAADLQILKLQISSNQR